MKGRRVTEIPQSRDVPGFQGRYLVDYDGTVWRRWQSGYSPLIPVMKRGNPIVRLQNHNGRRQEFLVARLVQLAWLGPTPEGKVRYHKDGCKTNNQVCNIGFIGRSDLGQMTGAKARRRAVVKYDNRGYAVDVYASAREAARQNFMSYQTVIDRCNGKVKSRYAPDGYRYEWEENTL